MSHCYDCRSYAREAYVGGKKCVAPEGDYYVTCSFDKNHVLLRSRMPYHIIKCIKNYPGHKKKRCPYDATEYIDEEVFAEHVTEKCLSRINNKDDRYQMMMLEEKGELCKLHVTPFVHNLPEPDEDWAEDKEIEPAKETDEYQLSVGRGTTKGSRGPLVGKGRAERLNQIWLQYQEKQRALSRSSHSTSAEISTERKSPSSSVLNSKEEKKAVIESGCGATKLCDRDHVQKQKPSQTAETTLSESESRPPSVNGSCNSEESHFDPIKSVGRGQILNNVMKKINSGSTSPVVISSSPSGSDKCAERISPMTNGLKDVEATTPLGNRTPIKGLGRAKLLHDSLKKINRPQTPSRVSSLSESDKCAERMSPMTNGSKDAEATPIKGLGRAKFLHDSLKKINSPQTPSNVSSLSESGEASRASRDQKEEPRERPAGTRPRRGISRGSIFIEDPNELFELLFGGPKTNVTTADISVGQFEDP